MKKVICDICREEIRDEHLLVPKHLWWVAPSINYVERLDVCRGCWNEMLEQIRERRKE